MQTENHYRTRRLRCVHLAAKKNAFFVCENTTKSSERLAQVSDALTVYTEFHWCNCSINTKAPHSKLQGDSKAAIIDIDSWTYESM